MWLGAITGAGAVHPSKMDSVSLVGRHSLHTPAVLQERAASALARIKQENAARQRREELEMQQLGKQSRTHSAPPPTHESGERFLCCLQSQVVYTHMQVSYSCQPQNSWLVWCGNITFMRQTTLLPPIQQSAVCSSLALTMECKIATSQAQQGQHEHHV